MSVCKTEPVPYKYTFTLTFTLYTKYRWLSFKEQFKVFFQLQQYYICPKLPKLQQLLGPVGLFIEKSIIGLYLISYLLFCILSMQYNIKILFT